MSGGLFALFDDVATLAKLAAASVDDVAPAAGKASAKAAGVVVDDTAVTPQYVHTVAAERELPIIKKIAAGSLRNKLLLILPALLVLSQFLPWLLTPLLMLGGIYLCYEGGEKIWENLRGHGPYADPEELAAEQGADLEQQLVSDAIRTDLVLSAEIMVIALNEVARQPLISRALILVVVAFALTVLVYGVVGLIVKMDDMGLSLTARKRRGLQRVGHALVSGMPRLLAVISVVGTVVRLLALRDHAQEPNDRGRRDRHGGHPAAGHADELQRRLPASRQHEQHPRGAVHTRLETAQHRRQHDRVHEVRGEVPFLVNATNGEASTVLSSHGRITVSRQIERQRRSQMRMITELAALATAFSGSCDSAAAMVATSAPVI